MINFSFVSNENCFADHMWPASHGLSTTALDSNISLKFLLGTTLQSEFFDTLDDLLEFRVEKL